MSSPKLRVMVVDDSVTFRSIITSVLEKIPDVEVVGKAGNGKAALMRIMSLKPDLITLDLNMPEMDGLSLLQVLKEKNILVNSIILSSLTVAGSKQTLKALEYGAFDFITKPDEGSVEQNNLILQRNLEAKIRIFRNSRRFRFLLKPKGIERQNSPVALKIKKDSGLPMKKPEVVIIGVSTGGPVALGIFLSGLSKNFPIPVVIVQHMPPTFTKTLAVSLNLKSQLPVKEAEDLEPLKPGQVYIAPGGKQMKLLKSSLNNNMVVSITDDPPESNCKPSVNYLFRSVAHNFPGKALAVIMTGMGNDGTLGLRFLKRHGCYSIAQDEASCVVFGMPMEAIKEGLIDKVVSLEQIAKTITGVIKVL